MNTLYVRCQTKCYILDIVAARAGMRINKVNSVKKDAYFFIKEFKHLQIQYNGLNQYHSTNFGVNTEIVIINIGTENTYNLCVLAITSGPKYQLTSQSSSLFMSF